MQTRITVSHDYGSVGHTWYPADEKCHAFGTLRLGNTQVHLYAPADIDEVIAELTALRAEMTAPAVTCSERTCDAKNPDTGDWCTAEGEHDEHRDTYGETWTAAGAVAA